MAVLRPPAARRRSAGVGLVGAGGARSVLPPVFAVATGAVVGAVQEGRRRPGHSSRSAWCYRVAGVGPLHQAVGENLGNRMSAWLYDELTDRVLLAAGHRPPRGPDADRRLRCPRVRQRSPPAANGGEPAVHRHGPGGPRHRGGVGRGAVGVRRWAPLCWAARGARPTGCCAKARSGRTATPTRCARPASRPSTPTGWRSTHHRQRRCGCSGWPTGSSTASRPGGAGSSAAGRHPAARAVDGAVRGDGVGGQRRGLRRARPRVSDGSVSLDREAVFAQVAVGTS